LGWENIFRFCWNPIEIRLDCFFSWIFNSRDCFRVQQTQICVVRRSPSSSRWKYSWFAIAWMFNSYFA
jgi:hypothetical protein